MAQQCWQRRVTRRLHRKALTAIPGGFWQQIPDRSTHRLRGYRITDEGPSASRRFGLLPTLPTSGAGGSDLLPPGLGGKSIWIQGAMLNAASISGDSTTEAHVVRML